MNLATVDHLLTTTRTVRKRLDFDRPVTMAVIEECLEIALQAPTGSNAQGWRFLVITDAAKRQRIGELYRESFMQYARSAGEQPVQEGGGISADPAQTMRVVSSAFWLAENMHRAPILILPCVLGRVENAGPMAQASLYGSILPATWSLMLALRSRGLGSAWTTLHLRYEQEVADLLGIPDHVTQAALLPVAYFTGDDFRPAKRVSADQVTYLEQWGTPPTDSSHPQ